MIINLRVEPKYRHVVVWCLRENVIWDDDAIMKNSEEGDYLYFTGLEYDIESKTLIASIKHGEEYFVKFKLEELEKLGMISDVIIDGD